MSRAHRAAAPGSQLLTGSVPVFKGPLLWAPKVPILLHCLVPSRLPTIHSRAEGAQLPTGASRTRLVHSHRSVPNVIPRPDARFHVSFPMSPGGTCLHLPDGKTGLGRASELPQVTQLVRSGTAIHTPRSPSQCSGFFTTTPGFPEAGKGRACVWVLCMRARVCVDVS